MDRVSRILRAMVCACTMLTLLIGATIWGSEAAAAPAIVTEDGPLKGIISPGINEFLGIPYAAPPLGALRWTPPQPHGHWQGGFCQNSAQLVSERGSR